MKTKNKNTKGFSIVEIIIATSMFAIFSTGIFYLSVDTIDRNLEVNNDSAAMFYAMEGLEAARNIRDNNYILLTNGDHGVDLTSGSWELSTAPEQINDIYQRVITINDTYRDESGNISDTGVYLDPDTKKIVVEISWLKNGINKQTTELTQYLSNWRGDDWIQTTCTEFDLGTYDLIDTIALEGPPTNNCGLKIEEIESASIEFGSANLGNHATDVDVDGSYAYISVNDTNKGFQIVNISNPSNLSVSSDLNIGKKGLHVKKYGSYAYLSINNRNGGLSIINVSNVSNPTIESNENIGAYGNTSNILNNYLFVAADKSLNSFLVYDVTSKSSPVLVNTVNLLDQVHAIEIKGNYAYLGMEDDYKGFRVLDISDPLNITEIASLDVDEDVNAISISGNIAFLGTEDSSSSLKVVNISDPANPSIIGTIDVGGEIQDLTISGNYLYAAVDNTNAGLAAINISNPYSPYFVYNLDVMGKGTGIDSDYNYVYITLDTGNKGLVIVGTTETGVTTNGSYVSQVFDTGSSETDYKFIEWEHTEVPGGNVKFQLRTSDSQSGIESETWIGPDGTSSSYYLTSRTPIVLSQYAGTRYCQFKAYIESDGTSSPIIQSVRINYIPW